MTVEQLIAEREGEQQQLLVVLDDWLTNSLGLRSKIRYRIPFYDQHSWICYLSPKGTEAVELCFLYGQQLADPAGILDAKDRKQVSGVRLTRAVDIPWDELEMIVQEAIWLDEQSAKKQHSS